MTPIAFRVAPFLSPYASQEYMCSAADFVSKIPSEYSHRNGHFVVSDCLINPDTIEPKIYTLNFPKWLVHKYGLNQCKCHVYHEQKARIYWIRRHEKFVR